MQMSDMIPGVNKTGRKVSIARVNGAGESGVLWDPNRNFRGWSTVRKFLGSKEHIDRLKKDLNATEIITVQDYKHKKKKVNLFDFFVKSITFRIKILINVTLF